ncbi:uncharacterized protein L969DRAFT_90178 [Mixia osmundae IAM 14324]|uniref:Uncharacterized protein n=1 Tax=Mixia osmundae (strain CBS 9802 / IAM 14324 / JCM 22182 / KY 12970) TaxID=764103 RepID=G7E8I0_MIXOS|nr:uncharacterized protein L969DRAFT_90162 [Mixia osmundae IAM 14324]XP_014565684.1 uncharacterized protein L969DRAFT_90178 [Mixia osmundae IAM 14324]KEI37103.1 hypothetical protein L969DRAFT_90162 [Mixia osmundae IAM 14324]KEI37115.1 hypothetical protein L969DRAFT_90178 [Mixia osmundae IAM 14324]GAA99140.1 hypothetical protein E5Q_05830 [Mixia osmundae IAM 14324]
MLVVYESSITSKHSIRSNQESVRRILAHLNPVYLDIANDESAKATYKRLSAGRTELPLVAVNGRYVGSVEQIQEANEHGELDQLLRLDEQEGDELNNLTEAEAVELASEINAIDNAKQASAQLSSIPPATAEPVIVTDQEGGHHVNPTGQTYQYVDSHGHDQVDATHKPLIDSTQPFVGSRNETEEDFTISNP